MRRNMGRRLSVVLAATAAGTTAVAGVAVAGHDGGKEVHRAKLDPVPHAASADSGSDARGSATLMRRGNQLDVKVRVRGVSPNLPHAMHIHGKDAGELAFCPGKEARNDLVDDGLIETLEGVSDYGGIQVSFTTRGDTSPASALALNRFPVARANGILKYDRTFSIPRSVAENLDDKHIVIHGHDLDGDGRYGGRITALGAPLEAELPVACGEIDRKNASR